MDADVRESYRWCVGVARREAANFYYSFLPLSRDRREDMCAVYAFMRATDDIADADAPPAVRRERLDAWEANLRAALEGGAPDGPAWRALEHTVARRSIPHRFFHELLEGARMDLEPVVYQNFEELKRYCYHVAGVVGFVCIHVWGFDAAGGRAMEAAEACGIALQLTNVIRDVREDAARGRIYLPAEDLERFRVRPADLAADTPTPALRELVRHEVDRAREYYTSGAELLPLVHPGGRATLRIMLGIYGAILTQIEAAGYDVVSRRARVSTPRKAAIVSREWMRAVAAR